MNAAHASRPSFSGFPSDTNLLVDACIASVRQAARLDDDAVLPPLPVVAPRREVAMFTKREMAGGLAGVTSVAGDAQRSRDQRATTLRVSRPKTRRWPTVLCGFVAATFACMAFLASPMGQRPEVKRVTHHVYGAAFSLVR